MHRTGTVTSVNAEKHTARVRFNDSPGEHESADLQVLAVRRGDYALPQADDVVLCALDDGPEGLGWVLGIVYPEGAPPLADAGQRSIQSDDLRLGAFDATLHAAIAEYVDDRLQTVQATFDSHIHTTTATIGPSAAVGVISPPTSLINALDGVGSDTVKVAE